MSCPLRRRPGMPFLPVVAMLLLTPGHLLGQSCFGVPTQGGQWALGGSLQFSVDAKAYGPAVTVHTGGPLVLSAEYLRIDPDDLDDSGNGVWGRIAYELHAAEWSICPYSGFAYGWMTGEMYDGEFRMESSSWSVPLGVGIGRSFEIGPETSITPYAVPQFYYSRSEIEVSMAGTDLLTESDSGGELGGTVGIAVRVQRVVFSGFFQDTTDEDSDVVFGIAVAVLLN